MASGIIKDVKEIYSSVFDHKPAINREVDYFVKQFEESRKDREVDRLFKILERVTELQGSEIGKVRDLGDIHLPKLSAELQVAESIANKLVERRKGADEGVLAKLEIRREERANEWNTFVHDMTAKCVKIDNNYLVRQEEVKEAFRKTEEKIFTKKLEELEVRLQDN